MWKSEKVKQSYGDLLPCPQFNLSSRDFNAVAPINP